MHSESDPGWLFQLFVSEENPRTNLFLSVLKEICKAYLKGKYNIEVINVMAEPIATIKANVIATPTLLKASPKPEKRIIGDLSNKSKIVELLGIDVSKG